MPNPPTYIEQLENIAAKLMQDGEYERASLVHSSINLLDQIVDIENEIRRIESGLSGIFVQLFGSTQTVLQLKAQKKELLNQAHDLLDKADV